MVVVPKSNGDVRICLDPSKLNESILREVHPLPIVDYTLAKLAGSTVFSKLDCNSGFWQIPLSEESAPITTFITPWGRYNFNVLPFEITPASEHFQKQLEMVLKDCEGVCIEIDDILVHGKDTKEHDERLKKVLQKLEEANVTLNGDKCEFSKPEVHCLGHVINATGISADPEKVCAITEMSSPNSIQEARRFLGMCNQLSKFSLGLAYKTKPIQDLLSDKTHWNWGIQQEEAFKEIKKILSNTPVLALYDPKVETKICTDASSYRLGAILMQKQSNHEWQPVTYASRALSPTEQRYAQIEKALGIMWGCEKFSEYISGMKFHIETDHKPLVPIFMQKSLNNMSPRIQQF
ncbi:Retrovirus-related Pol poly from transposon opus [Paramuricea clavata]|uniref:Retrovirus-related Pol poly from transposon opus n=1 Tax=Paramuricea clavata TaxID=317549 RepID=A0A7D9HGL1_PARCT|nr:Retrovirus-related Pol poly from transposon opus [Paramuricea clavata]